MEVFEMPSFALLIAQVFVCGFLAAAIAKQKVHDDNSGLSAVMFFSFLGSPVAAGLSDFKARRILEENRDGRSQWFSGSSLSGLSAKFVVGL